MTREGCVHNVCYATNRVLESIRIAVIVLKELVECAQKKDAIVDMAMFCVNGGDGYLTCLTEGQNCHNIVLIERVYNVVEGG